MKELRIICLISIVFFISCNEKKEQPSGKKTEKKVKLLNQSPGTTAMANELNNLVSVGNPNEYYHWNSKRAQISKAEIANAAPKDRVQKFFKYCIENLQAGNSEETIKEIELILKQLNISKNNYQPEHKNIYDLLALSYLRDGEQKNCVNNHNEFSCLIPLLEEGQYIEKQSSEKAIELLKLICKEHPEDLQNRWLLNLSQMTIGNYPKSLSKTEFLKLPDNNIKFPRFNEIAMALGVAQKGLSGGVCIDDFNSDGYLDIFCTSYGMEDQAQYFQNDGKGGFINATINSGIKGIDGGLNCLHADYDGDGHKDILILRGGWLGKAGAHPNSLLKNKGDGTFEDVTYKAGLSSKYPCQTATFFDYDLDGDLDIFFGNESTREYRVESELFQNQGNGTFVNVTAQAGIGFYGFVKGVTSSDYNNDGYPDLYISILGSPNILFQNQKNGTFQNVTKIAGVSEPKMSFPTWFFDVNNDGWQDIFVGSFDARRQNIAAHDYAAELLNLAPVEEQPRLYLNQKDGTFKEVSQSFGVRKSMYAMGSNYGDLDMDGYLDFYIGTGTPHLGSTVPNRMFKNFNGNRFEEVTYLGGFGHVQKGHGVAFADINNDGDQEVYAVMGGAFEGDTFTNILFDNKKNLNKWINIDLEGSNQNVDAIGAKVKITTNLGQVNRVVSTGGSFGSSPLRLEIGLGNCDSKVDISIIWPDKNKSQTIFKAVTTNNFYKIKQLDNSIDVLDLKSYNFNTLNKNHSKHH